MITVFGPIDMDLLFSLPHLPAVGETVLTPAYTRAMGGKGANQAVAAARNGGTVRFVGSIGADGFGNEARSVLQAEGIDLAGFATVDAATCVASVCFDTQGRNQIAVASGANLLTRADALRPEILASGDWLVLQMEIPSDEVSKAVALAKVRGPHRGPAPLHHVAHRKSLIEKEKLPVNRSLSIVVARSIDL